jgi:Flp pilus assembly protein TadG
VTAAATDRGSAPDERGHVFIEFLFIVLPLLCLFLGTLQTVLLYSAKLATLQAARVAARTAAVLPVDDPDLVRLAAATPLLAAVPPPIWARPPTSSSRPRRGWPGCSR